MANKKRSHKGKGSYARYKAENRFQKNLAKKRARHAKKHPNDKQVGKDHTYRRKAPKGPNNTTPRNWNLRDASGKLIPQPAFKPKFMLEEEAE